MFYAKESGSLLRREKTPRKEAPPSKYRSEKWLFSRYHLSKLQRVLFIVHRIAQMFDPLEKILESIIVLLLARAIYYDVYLPPSPSPRPHSLSINYRNYSRGIYNIQLMT